MTAPPTIRLAPLAVWLAVQGAALSASAGRVPFAANYLDPAERLASHVMLVAQASAAGLLFPWLLAGLPTAAAVAASAVPMLLAAGVLAGTPLTRSAVAAAFGLLWLLNLFLLGRLLPADGRWDGPASAGVNLLTLGPPVLLYLQADFAPPPPGSWAAVAGRVLENLPLPATGPVLSATHGGIWPWAAQIFFAVALSLALLSPSSPSRRQLLHSDRG